MSLHLHRYLIFTFVALAISGCGKRQIRIDHETRRMIDTLAAHEIILLRPQTDSLCEAQLPLLIASMRDSILAVRREEMRKLLGK
jgi:hypothetical protein